MREETNWAGNYRYRAISLHCPETVAQVQELVAGSRRVKALGARHSFNSIADTTETLVSLARFDRITALDATRRTVTVEAGVRYGQLGQYLHSQGYALHNLASLPHISVAGACATATHGSGDGNGNLATAVAALKMVTAAGEVVALFRERDGETFLGAVVGLGGLGIVTELTLDIAPTFAVRQDVYENLPLAQLEAHFEEIVSSAYSVSLFTNWRDAKFNQVWRKRRVTDDALNSDAASDPPEREWFGAVRAARPLHPIGDLPAENATPQLGIPGPWHERLPHFRMEFMPSSGEELQTEYLLPRRHALAALRALHELRDHITPLLQISEVRTVAGDALWMSPCYGQACVAVHFTWKKDWAAVARLLPKIETALAPFEARPHWGKLFTMPPSQLQSRYERLPDFQRLLRRYDPQGKFRNEFLDTYLYGSDV